MMGFLPDPLPVRCFLRLLLNINFFLQFLC